MGMHLRNLTWISRFNSKKSAEYNVIGITNEKRIILGVVPEETPRATPKWLAVHIPCEDILTDDEILDVIAYALRVDLAGEGSDIIPVISGQLGQHEENILLDKDMRTRQNSKIDGISKVLTFKQGLPSEVEHPQGIVYQQSVFDLNTASGVVQAVEEEEEVIDFSTVELPQVVTQPHEQGNEFTNLVNEEPVVLEETDVPVIVEGTAIVVKETPELVEVKPLPIEESTDIAGPYQELVKEKLLLVEEKTKLVEEEKLPPIDEHPSIQRVHASKTQADSLYLQTQEDRELTTPRGMEVPKSLLPADSIVSVFIEQPLESETLGIYGYAENKVSFLTNAGIISCVFNSNPVVGDKLSDEFCALVKKLWDMENTQAKVLKRKPKVENILQLLATL